MSRHLKNYVATRAATRLVMDAAKSEKAKAGRVTMPKVFLLSGLSVLFFWQRLHSFAAGFPI